MPEVTARELRRLLAAILVRDFLQEQPGARQDRRKDATRPASDWVTVDAPQLRVVTDAQWTAAHRRLEMAAQTYARGRNGQLLGRPPTGLTSTHFLTGLSECG